MGLYTNTMRFTGTSGIDVESMVTQLMKAESLKYDKLAQKRQLLEWKQSAYHTVASNMLTFQKSYLDIMAPASMRSPGTFNAYKFTTKIGNDETTAIKVTGTSSTKNGISKLKVLQLATADTYTSAKQQSFLTSTNSITAANFADFTASDTFNIKLDDGTNKTISFTDAEVSELKNAATTNVRRAAILSKKFEVFGCEDGTLDYKVRAEYDAVSDKMSIKTTLGHSVTVSANSTRTSELTGSLLGNVPAMSNGKFQIEVGGKTLDVNVSIENGDTTADYVKKLNTALAKTLSENNIGGSVRASLSGTTLTGYSIKLAASNTTEDITLLGSTPLSSALGLPSDATLKHTNPLADFGFTSSTSTKVDLKKTLGEVFGITTKNTVQLNGKSIVLDPKATVESLITQLGTEKTGVTLSYDPIKSSFILKSNNTGVENAISDDAKGAGGFLQQLGFLPLASPPLAGPTHSAAKDAIIEYNGDNGANADRLTRSTNSFTIDGLSIQLNQTTENKITGQFDEIVINTDKDNSGTFDLVKKFIDSYNEMINGLNTEYRTGRAKKADYEYYQPLTSDQRMAMSDKDIENWEAKAKEGILNRDEILSKALSTFRSMMYESVTLDNGSKISLYEIGITTSSKYSDGGQLVIDEDKLRKALAERGDDVTALFTKRSEILPSAKGQFYNRLKDEGISDRMDDIINSIAGSNGSIMLKAGSALFTGVLSKELTAMDKKISEMNAALIKKEERYYAQFSKMEAAMNMANSQLASLDSLLTSSSR